MNIFKENDISINQVKFSKKPISIPASYRPVYKITLILIIIYYTGRGGKCSLLKLHFISYFLKDAILMDELVNSLEGEENLFTYFSWSIEPSLIRALRLALADDFIVEKEGNYVISDKGNIFLKKVLTNIDILILEKDTLKKIGKTKINDFKIEKYIKERSY
ncbi:MAG: hypothetical protein WC667_11760 [Sulfurimonas sp.]|jgi:hypothetical protein